MGTKLQIDQSESVYQDSDKFERLVNNNFSFQNRFGSDGKIEQKYAEIILQKKKDRFRNVMSSKMTDLFS